MAQAAEQASQSKSMFLATVSHELRTPLYGIIGNLDLLQTKELPRGVDRLVTAMNNSSSLLLKIISDILDFSKIESEQLKIEPREFSPREVMNHISANYLPLVVRKQLGLYCFIEPVRTAPLLPSLWREMATRLCSGAMTQNISQRCKPTAVTRRSSPMCLSPTRCISKAISRRLWQPAVTFWLWCQAMSLVRFFVRLNR
jgi:signal transduction histidine kinase